MVSAEDWQVMLEPSYTIRGLWVAESGQAWACNQGGQILHHDGTGWQVAYEAGPGVITGIWGFSETDIYAAQPPGLLHYDGTHWRSFPTPPRIAITELWGTEDGILFGAGTGGAIVRRVGETWKIMESGTTRHFRSLWGTGADHVLALDSSGALHRYDGEAWAEFEGVPADQGLGIWASAPANVIMMVPDGALRFDGTSWQKMNDLPGGVYHEIWGHGAGDLFLVGREFAHHDGQGWTIQDKPTRGALDVVHGNGSGAVYAAGLLGQIWVRDSGVWREQVPVGKSQWFTDVWGFSDQSLFVTCGDFAGVYYWDGVTWTQQDLPANSPQALTVWGTSRTDVHVAGSGGHILHFDGERWSSQELDQSYAIQDMWGSSESHVFAVGNDMSGNGRILFFDGRSWTALEETWERGFLAIGGTGPDNVYVSWDGASSFLHFDGTAWSPVRGDTPAPPKSVWLEGATGYAVGYDGTIQVLKNGVWKSQSSGVTEDLEAVWGTGQGEAIAVGSKGCILRYDGREWSAVPSPAKLHLYGVWGLPDGPVYAVGKSGVVLKME